VEYYSTTKNNTIVLFVEKWMELEIIKESETSETQKDKYHVESGGEGTHDY
jgi:hypothetical protein